MKKENRHWLAYFLLVAFFPLTLFCAYAPQYWDIKKRETLLSAAPSTPLSPYDDIIKKHSGRNGLDWRLVASIIYNESSFRMNAVSPDGAMGLMQLMPVAFKQQGVKINMQPDVNIQTGIKHLNWKIKKIRGRTPEDAMRLSLAAYNAGLAHLRDAQNLAMKLNKNPRKWVDVKQMLLKLEEPGFYKDAKYGRCRGSETVEYVEKVWNRYQRYREKYPSPAYQITVTEAASSNHDA